MMILLIVPVHRSLNVTQDLITAMHLSLKIIKPKEDFFKHPGNETKIKTVSAGNILQIRQQEKRKHETISIFPGI